ncbi:MAG: glycoside hydrolase family 16 protein [Hyphomonadaceae bacterium]
MGLFFAGKYVSLRAIMLGFVGAFVAIGAGNQAVAQGAPTQAEAPAKWSLIWSDEFDGTAIDASKWSHAVDCWGGGNNEKQCYTERPENSFVKDGNLVIQARKERRRGYALPVEQRTNKAARAQEVTLPYSSAKLVTKGKADWRYGRISVRARLPQGQGTWPAIWLLPADEVYGPWAASGEIDIMEAVNLGEPCANCPGGVENTILGTLHYGGAWPKNTFLSKTTPLVGRLDDFHTYTLDWDAGKMVWSIDGVPYATQTPATWHVDQSPSRPSAPFDQKFYLILNLAIGGNLAEGRNLRGVSPKNFPKTMEIDWVRVYKCERSHDTASCGE